MRTSRQSGGGPCASYCDILPVGVGVALDLLFKDWEYLEASLAAGREKIRHICGTKYRSQSKIL